MYANNKGVDQHVLSAHLYSLISAFVRPNKKSKLVSGNSFFFWKKKIILCILKGMPFKMHQIIFFQKN